MSATQTDPLHSGAVRIASVLSNHTRNNTTPDGDTIQFSARLSAILAVDSNFIDPSRPAVEPIGLSSPDLNEPAVTSSLMQASKPQSGAVETPDSISPLRPAKADMKTMRPAEEQDGLLPSERIIQMVAGPPAANRQFSPSVTAVTDVAENRAQTTDQPPRAIRVLDNVKAHQVGSKLPAARKPSSPDDQTLPDSASSTTTPVLQPGVSPQIPPEPMSPVRVTSVPLQSADGRTSPLPKAHIAAFSANARSADHLLTSVSSKPEDRASARRSGTVSNHLSDARDGAADITPLPGPDFAAPARSANYLSTPVTSKPGDGATTRLSRTESSHPSGAGDSAANIMPLADGRVSPLAQAHITAVSTNPRSADQPSTSVTPKTEDRATARFSDTVSGHLSDARDGAANIIALARPDFVVPVTASSGAAQTQHGVGIPLAIAYGPMTISTASRSIVATVTAPDQITRPGDGPTDRQTEILPPFVDTAPSATTTKPRRSSSSVIDPTNAIEPLKLAAVKNDAVLSDLIPAALSTPVVRSMPDSPKTTIVTQPGPVALRSENPAAPKPVAAAFGAQANPQAGAQAQVGASVLTLASGPDGSSQMALTLHPKELGAVHIQFERNSNGAVRIVVTASEPATLRSLMNDQAHLHATLDAAAIPSADRHLSFELGTPATSAVASDHAAVPSVVERVPDTVSASRTDAWTNADMAGFRGSDPQAGNNGRDPGNAFSRSGRDPRGDPGMGDTDSSPPVFKSSGSTLPSSSRINITA